MHISGALLAIVNCHDIAFMQAAERFAPQSAFQQRDARCPEQGRDRAAIRAVLIWGQVGGRDEIAGLVQPETAIPVGLV
jgi:hypothetical protein